MGKFEDTLRDNTGEGRMNAGKITAELAEDAPGIAQIEIKEASTAYKIANAPPKKKKSKVTVSARIDSELKDKADETARSLGLSFTEYLERGLIMMNEYAEAKSSN